MEAASQARAAAEAAIEYDGELPDDIRGTPFAIFRAKDIWDRLASHPDTRAHIADSGFRASVEKLRAISGQAAAREVMDDPRLMQALMAMSGDARLKIKEEELNQAEVGGRMRRRDPVQFSHMERAHAHASAAAAKEAGNAHFTAGAFADAAACYERALALSPKEGAPAFLSVVLLSNCAAALLKLRRGADALRCCEAAVEAAATATRGAAHAALAALAVERPSAAVEPGVEPGVLSKVHYRRAQALEMERRFAEAAAALRSALGADRDAPAALRRELGRVQKLARSRVEPPPEPRVAPPRVAPPRGGRGLSARGAARVAPRPRARTRAPQQQGSSEGAPPAPPAPPSPPVLQAARAEADAREAVLQREREAAAAQLRAAGVPLPASRPSSTALAAAPRALGAARGYVREIDFGHWAAGWLAKQLRGLTHRGGGCTLVVRALDLEQSEVHASVKLKDDRRALFYDLTLVVHWEGAHESSARGGDTAGAAARGAAGGAGSAERAMSGVLRMYNIGQDTRYAPGGDKETSYMFELGFPQKYFGAAISWVEALKAEAVELFHAVSGIVGRWVAELQAKATAASAQ